MTTSHLSGVSGYTRSGPHSLPRDGGSQRPPLSVCCWEQRREWCEWASDTDYKTATTRTKTLPHLNSTDEEEELRSFNIVHCPIWRRTLHCSSHLALSGISLSLTLTSNTLWSLTQHPGPNVTAPPIDAVAHWCYFVVAATATAATAVGQAG